jgi:hypothetical protein
MAKIIRFNVYRIINKTNQTQGYIAKLFGGYICEDARRFRSSNLKLLASQIFKEYEYPIFYAFRPYRLEINENPRLSTPYGSKARKVRIDHKEKKILEDHFQDLWMGAIAHKWG